MQFYILHGHTVVPALNELAYKIWFESHDRRVAEDYVDRLRISTVFTGLPYGSRPHKVFETMVERLLDGKLWEDENPGALIAVHRYATWDEAVFGHTKMLSQIKETVQ